MVSLTDLDSKQDITGVLLDMGGQTRKPSSQMYSEVPGHLTSFCPAVRTSWSHLLKNFISGTWGWGGG